MWSFAIVLWEMIATVDNPFLGMAPLAYYQAAIGSGIRPPIELKSSPSPEYVSLIIECWNSIPSERPDFPAIVSKLQDISRALVVAPTKI